MKAALLDTRFAATGNLAEWVARGSSELAFERSPWERICGGNAGAASPDGATAPMSRKGDAPLSNGYTAIAGVTAALAHTADHRIDAGRNFRPYSVGEASDGDMALLCAETQQIDCQDGNRLQPHLTDPNQETVRLPDFFSPTPFPIASLSKQLIVQIWLAFQPLWTPNSNIHS